jgi:hypothetical protein
VREDARPLIGLEHAIAECIVLGELKVGSLGWIHVLVLRIRLRTIRRSLSADTAILIDSIHPPVVVHLHECLMRVTEVVVVRQRYGSGGKRFG